MVAHINLGIPNHSAIHNRDIFDASVLGVLTAHRYPPIFAPSVSTYEATGRHVTGTENQPSLNRTGSPVSAYMVFPSLRTDRNTWNVEPSRAVTVWRTKHEPCRIPDMARRPDEREADRLKIHNLKAHRCFCTLRILAAYLKPAN